MKYNKISGAHILWWSQWHSFNCFYAMTQYPAKTTSLFFLLSYTVPSNHLARARDHKSGHETIKHTHTHTHTHGCLTDTHRREWEFLDSKTSLNLWPSTWKLTMKELLVSGL